MTDRDYLAEAKNKMEQNFAWQMPSDLLLVSIAESLVIIADHLLLSQRIEPAADDCVSQHVADDFIDASYTIDGKEAS